MKRYCKQARKILKKLRIRERKLKIKKPDGLYYRPKRPFTLCYGQEIPCTVEFYQMFKKDVKRLSNEQYDFKLPEQIF